MLIAPLQGGKVAAIMVGEFIIHVLTAKLVFCFDFSMLQVMCSLICCYCCCIARVTALSCQWLMGPCAVNNVDLPDGSSLRSGVMV